MTKNAPDHSLTSAEEQAIVLIADTASTLASILDYEKNAIAQRMAFDPTILVGREYPGRLTRGMQRAVLRLGHASDALNAASRDAIAAAQRGAFTNYAMPAMPGTTTSPRSRDKRVRVKEIKALLGTFPHYVQSADHHLATIKRIEAQLAIARKVPNIDRASKNVEAAADRIRDFKQYFDYLHQHAMQMVDAIIHADGGKAGKGHPFPPLKMKVRPVRADGGKGKRPPSGGVKGVPAGKFPAAGSSQQDVACWLARKASAAGLPPVLPLVCAMPESTLNPKAINSSSKAAGLFQILPGLHPVPPGYGKASGTKQSADWWTNHPEAQWDWFVKEAKAFRPSGDVSGKNVANWAYAIERPGEAQRYTYSRDYPKAAALLKACEASSAGAGHVPRTQTHLPGGHGKATFGSAALKVAMAELAKGVRETNGNNWSADIKKYLNSTGINTPAAWCAAFVHWSLERAGFKFPSRSTSWASCSTYLAEANRSDGQMYKVSHSEAKPGDLLVFNDGHHIAMVQSVSNGVIKVVGGNQSNAITIATHNVSDSSYSIIRPRAQ
ncbi:MAG: CHAP domain-containing protein [Patulibacter minatonensis]